MQGWRQQWQARWPIAVLVAAFAVSRALAAVAGVRFDDSILEGTFATDKYQLLDVNLLKHHLVESVWHLNSQPPLFNLFSGTILKLPHGAQRPFETVCALALGLVLVLCTYLVMVELGVPQWVALAVTVVGVVASPAYLLFENWLDYAYPTAAMGALGAWCLIRFLRTRRIWFGVGFFGAYAVIVMLDSTYQIEWLVVASGVVVVVLHRHWRRVLVVAVIPLLVVVTWYAKNEIMFGTSTTSSWLGMNVARLVLYKAPPSTLKKLEQQGTLTPLASVPAFGNPEAYVPRFVKASPNAIAALGQLIKADGATNFNNPLYIKVSSQYLHDDLAYIAAEPSAYLSDINASIQVWLVPSDQNFANSLNWPHMHTYSSVYDRLVEWQPSPDPAAAEAAFLHTPSPLAWLSLQTIVVYLCALIGGPILAWRRRRTDPGIAGTLAVLWWTTAYGLAVSSLVEIGENERFRFELGPVPLVLATVVITTAVRSWWRRGHPRTESIGQPSLFEEQPRTTVLQATVVPPNADVV